MPRQKTRRLVERAYPNGQELFGPFAFPFGLADFSVSIGRCTSADTSVWPDENSSVTVKIETSKDGGQTYAGPSIVVGPIFGGIKINPRSGLEIPETVATLSASDGADVTHARGIVTFDSPSTPIKTYVDTEMFE